MSFYYLVVLKSDEHLPLAGRTKYRSLETALAVKEKHVKEGHKGYLLTMTTAGNGYPHGFYSSEDF